MMEGASALVVKHCLEKRTNGRRKVVAISEIFLIIVKKSSIRYNEFREKKLKNKMPVFGV